MKYKLPYFFNKYLGDLIMADIDDITPPSPPEGTEAVVQIKTVDAAQAALDEARKLTEGKKTSDAAHVVQQLDVFESALKDLRKEIADSGYVKQSDLTEEQRQILFSARPENKDTFLGFLGRVLFDPWE